MHRVSAWAVSHPAWFRLVITPVVLASVVVGMNYFPYFGVRDSLSHSLLLGAVALVVWDTAVAALLCLRHSQAP
jgi:hypothetical protein